MTRGCNNNNPGNIKLSGAHWLGKMPSRDPEFEVFDTAQHGIRALAKILLTYQINHKLDTIREIISRWAPSSENDVEAYVTSVCGQTVTSPDAKLDLREPDVLAGLCEAIIHQENGTCPYPMDVIEEGVRMALASIS